MRRVLQLFRPVRGGELWRAEAPYAHQFFKIADGVREGERRWVAPCGPQSKIDAEGPQGQRKWFQPAVAVHGLRSTVTPVPSCTVPITRQASGRATPGGRCTADQLARILTDREMEVLTMVARGLSNGEIAEELTISPATAKTHVAHLLTKLDARDRIQLVIMAYQSGLVTTLL